MQFCFSHKDHIRVRLRLTRHQRHMWTSESYRNSARPELRGKCVGVIRAGRMERDANQIHSDRRVDPRHLFIDMNNVPFRPGECSQIWHRDLLEIQKARATRLLNRRRRRRDEEERSASRHEIARESECFLTR